MQGDANVPAEVVAPAATLPAAKWRNAIWLLIGGIVGLAVGIVATTGVFTTYRFLTPTLPLTTDRDPVLILTELNELRHQVNQLNDTKKLQTRETDEATRRVLTTLTSMVRTQAIGVPGVPPPAEKSTMAAGSPPTQRGYDPFAELDAEIKNLENTQAILNSILDLFLPTAKEPAKGSRPAPSSPD